MGRHSVSWKELLDSGGLCYSVVSLSLQFSQEDLKAFGAENPFEILIKLSWFAFDNTSPTPFAKEDYNQ